MPRRAIGWTVLTAMVACTLALTLGFWMKNLCTRHTWDGYQYRTSCYNDIYALYFFRGLNTRTFPYIHGDGVLENERDSNGNPTEIGDLEYPVVTGYFIGGIEELTHDGRTFFDVNALALGICGFVAVFLITLIAAKGWRILYFALAPSLVLYAFHNWDLLAVVFMCGGIFAFYKRADRTSGVLLGVGAAAKVFPGLILPALALSRWRAGEKRGVIRLLGSSLASFIVLNVPIALANARGWWMPWKFQSTRFPNFETWGYMIYRHLSHIGGAFWRDTYPQATSYAAFAMWTVLAFFLVRADARSENDRPFALSFQLLLAFLLAGKVYSPQYALWILPFFVLVEMPWYSFAAFAITDASVWFAVSAYFLAAPPVSAGGFHLRLVILEICVWVRYAVLVWLIALARRRPENVYEPERKLPFAAIPAEAAA